MRLYIYPPSAAITVPPGLATAANQVLEIAALNSILTALSPMDIVEEIVFDFAVTNVDNSVFVPVFTNGATAGKKVQVFMSSGEPLLIQVGATAKGIIIPGGNGVIDLAIPATAVFSVKAVNAVTVNSGNLIINVFG